MTASGARETLPGTSAPLIVAAVWLAAIGLLLAGFVYGTSRVVPKQAAQPVAVAPIAVDDNAPDMAPPIYVGPAPVVPAGPASAGSRVGSTAGSAVRPVSESVVTMNYPQPYRIPVIGWPMSRSAGLHPCSPGTVIADTMSVVAHGPSCALSASGAAASPARSTGQRPPDESIDVITRGGGAASPPTSGSGLPVSRPGLTPNY